MPRVRGSGGGEYAEALRTQRELERQEAEEVEQERAAGAREVLARVLTEHGDTLSERAIALAAEAGEVITRLDVEAARPYLVACVCNLSPEEFSQGLSTEWLAAMLGRGAAGARRWREGKQRRGRSKARQRVA